MKYNNFKLMAVVLASALALSLPVSSSGETLEESVNMNFIGNATSGWTGSGKFGNALQFDGADHETS